ncbi:MAG: DNA-3-methyladenine glycosylase 2 family protein [Thermoflexibacter sp.]|jgi:DNA-3-methyladenine glycosylase II|nr:DNA-3-methyladenine glycosylase 2 family protein [Thermoflexibacter sp.]
MDFQEQIIAHLSKDPILAKAMAETEFMPYIKTVENNLFIDLLEAIISQQLSIKAADTIYKRFVGLFDLGKIYPSQILKFDDPTLRAVGLSNQKTKYIKNLAEFATHNSLEIEEINKKSDEEIIGLLTQIKGIGRWTVEMMLMFSLQRPNVFPIDDLGIYQSMIELYQIDETNKKETRKKLYEIAEHWNPYRSWACRYLWKWRDKKIRK